MSSTQTTLRTCAAALLLIPALAAAQEPLSPAPPQIGSGQCDLDTEARLRYLEDTLDESRIHARLWWNGWLGFYALGTAVQSVQAGLEGEPDDRANYIVGAVKALFGTLRLLTHPAPAARGAEPLREIPIASPEDCATRLALGEDILGRAAKDARSRTSWKRHLFNVGLNAAGGLIAAEAFDSRPAGWVSAGVGVAVGEAMIWTMPWRGVDDLAEYERRFAPSGAAGDSQLSWRIVPVRGGAGIEVIF